LTGPNATAAVDAGLAEAAWFVPPIDPNRLTELQRRSNGHAAATTIGWLGLLIAFGALAWRLWPSPWAIVAVIPYGALYGGAADSRWHEMGHNSAFRSSRLNDAVYHLASFMLWREATVWRWSHDRHHTDTLIVGRDLEIAFQRPTTRLGLAITFSGVRSLTFWKRIWRHARGGRDPEVAAFMSEDEWPKVHTEARVYLAIMAAVIVSCLVVGSVLPVVLIGAPTVYGMWLMVFFGITQHAGLQENVLDHRRNTRTVYMNPVFRFLYLNMNYHIEHHIFPTVPYYNLPALHAEMKPYLPEPLPSTVAAYREIFTTLAAQRADEAYELGRVIPEVPEADHRRVSIAGNGPVVTVDGDRALVSTIGLDVGRVRRIDVGDQSFALFRVGPDQYRLTDGFCTHGQAHVADGVVIDCSIVECPKHNGRFDLATGEPVRRPVKEPLGVYEVTRVAGKQAVTFVLPHPAGSSSDYGR
ncbi:MAG: fatty acid desaturase, partial [Acidimicrobiia bacterium]|nr:fatty acid desaturase [Acidimicrobiia bacterium]